MMKRSPILLIAVFLRCALAADYMKPCDVSWLWNSYIVVLNKYGVVWTDGDKHGTLDSLNSDIDQMMDRVKRNTQPFLRDSAKMFVTDDFVIFTGAMEGTQNTVVRWGSVKRSDFESAERFVPTVRLMNSFDQPVEDLYGGIKWEELTEGESQNQIFVCDSASIFLRRTNSQLAVLGFDNHQGTISLGLTFWKARVEYTNNVTAKCGKRSTKAMESLGVMRDDNTSIVYEDPKWKDAERGTYFLNQMEHGKFKLHAQLVETDGKRFYYHVLTRLYRDHPLTDADECYIRKFTSTKQMEFPRMLLISKKNRTAAGMPPVMGVPTTTTVMATATEGTPDPDIPLKRGIIETRDSMITIRSGTAAVRISSLLVLLAILS